MAVMTPNNKERTSLGSYRMIGAFIGGMVVSNRGRTKLKQ